MQFQRVYPQSASRPITTTLRKDERTTEELNDLSGLNTQQSVVKIGDTVPIIFCSVGGDGGVWVAPPAVRWGFSNSGPNVQSCFALTLGEGPIGGISAADVYKGEKTGGGTILNVSQGYSGLSFICSFSNSISQQYIDTSETFIGASGSSGIPTAQTTSTRAEGGGTLSYTSKTDRCVSLTGSLSGTYRLQGQGNGLDGFPAYIVGKTNTSGTITHAALASRYYQSSQTSLTVNWYSSTEFTPNDNYPGQGVGRRTVTRNNPYRSAGSIYPSNETFGTIPTQGNIDSGLSSASSFASNRVTSLGISPYTGTRNSQYIGSGTTLSVVEDSFTLRVTEVTRTFYKVPSVPQGNGSGGSFAGLATLSVLATSLSETDEHLNQVYVYVRNGVQVPRLFGGTGSSSLLPDLFRYLLSKNNLSPASLVDTDSLLLSAYFNNAEGLNFNGMLSSATNFRDYFQRIAPFFLLTYTQIQGKPGLRPILPINPSNYRLDLTPVAIKYRFNPTEIVEGSLEYEYRPLEERKPFCALMLWRNQPAARPGVERITEVRYSGQAVDGPFEQYDMSEFCTSEAHAIKVGKYLLAIRRHSTHLVRFKVAGIAAVMGLRPGDYITITDEATPSMGGPVSKTETYVLTELMEDPAGAISVTAEHSPVDAGGVSLISKDILGAAYSMQ